MCKHFVVVFKAQKKHTTLQVKMYTNGCKKCQVWMSARQCYKMLEIFRKVQILWSWFSSSHSIYVHVGWLLTWILVFWLGWKSDGRGWMGDSHREEVFARQPCTDGFARKTWMMTADPLFPAGTLRERTPAFSVQGPPLWVLISQGWRNITLRAGVGSI